MKFLALLVCVAVVCSAHAQKKDSADQKAFERAISLVEDKRNDEALLAFYEFMSVYPDSPLLARAHYNIGYLQFVRRNYEAATIVFKQIVDSGYDDRDPNGLMEPYMLYKHHSCRMLAEMSLEQKKYKAAEEYIRMFEHDYPYQHFCGNELSANAIYTATMKARAYDGQGKPLKAIQELVPYIFNNGLASNEDLLQHLNTILYHNYSIDQLHEEFTRALNSCQVKVTKRSIEATLTLFGQKVAMNYFYDEDETTTRDLDFCKKVIRKNKLFKKFL
jgi:tetratricopeptide (TPR) repeat protein